MLKCFSLITLSSICFEHPIVHLQEDLYMHCFNICTAHLHYFYKEPKHVLNYKPGGTRTWTPLETMAVCRSRNRSKDLIHGGKWWWWWCWWLWTKKTLPHLWFLYWHLKLPQFIMFHNDRWYSNLKFPESFTLQRPVLFVYSYIDIYIEPFNDAVEIRTYFKKLGEKLGLTNVLNPTGHVMHHQFIIQQLYALPTLYLCVLYLSENKQRLVPLTA